jgi:hypothetical protein
VNRFLSNGAARRPAGLALLSALLLALTAALPSEGARRDEPKKTFKTPATPKDAMLQVMEGMYAGNDEQVLKAVKADDKQKAFVRAVVLFVKNADDFRADFVKSYGKEKWDRFNDPNIDPGNGDGNATLTIPELKEQREQVEKATIDIKGAEANAEMTDKAGKKTKWKLVKVEDGWVVDAASLMEGVADVDMTTKQLTNLANLVKLYRKAIGKPGINPDDIDVELGRAIVKELLGIESNKPHRFDITKIKD